MTIEKIKKVACIGSGLIGSSWATLFAKRGYPVNIYDVNKEALGLAKEKIKSNFKIFVNNDVMTKEKSQEAMNRITYIDDLETTVKDVQFIQECVYEDLETKRGILTEIDKYNPTALFCSSTSYLMISDISRNSKYPERCIGAHPYNPPHLMPLVEITKCEKTGENNVKIAYDFYKSLGKEPVILKKETLGFIANRLQVAYLREAIGLVMKGICTVEDIDKASVYGLGIRWAIVGPNLNGDLNGGAGGLANAFGPKYLPAMNATLKNLTDWKEFPESYVKEYGAKGVEIEKSIRDLEMGKTREEIIAYRDKLLVNILKLHNKI